MTSSARRIAGRISCTVFPLDARLAIRRRVYMVQGKRVVHFLHINKTGGTAIKHALRPRSVTDDYAVLLQRHAVKLPDVPTGDLVFFFLRDPISRYISGFNARLRFGEPRVHYPWSEAETAAFSVFDSPNALALALSHPDAATRHSAVSAIQTITHVKSTISSWLVSTDYLRSRLTDIWFIGFQETLGRDFARLISKLGLPQDLELPGDKVAANRAPTNTKSVLSDQAISNLKKWYARDYELIEFCKSLRTRLDAES